jgi:NAD+ synthase (glutamine-hydrolysing)
VVGYVRQGDQRDPHSFRPSMRSAGRCTLYNAAAVIADRKVVGSYSKWQLPNYGVCDESRYFLPGHRLPMLLVNGTTIGAKICGRRKGPLLSTQRPAPR